MTENDQAYRDWKREFVSAKVCRQFYNSERLRREYEESLRPRPPTPAPTVIVSVTEPIKSNALPTIGPTLKVIKIGVLKTHDAYLKAYKDAGARIGSCAQSIFNQVPLAQTETELELAEVSVAELGFTDWTRYDVICKRAQERGYGLCPAEAALALRLAHLEQTKGEVLTVAMEALTGGLAGNRYVLDVSRYGHGLWLRASYGNPDGRFHPGNRLVFVRRKQSSGL